MNSSTSFSDVGTVESGSSMSATEVSAGSQPKGGRKTSAHWCPLPVNQQHVIVRAGMPTARQRAAKTTLYSPQSPFILAKALAAPRSVMSGYS